MSSALLNADGMRVAPHPLRSRVLAAVVLSGLVAVLYAPVLKLLVLQWWQDPNYCHGFLVPLFAAYVLWRDRARWRRLPSTPSNAGLALMLLALALLMAGTLGAELFVSRLSLLVLIAGIAVFFAGWNKLRAVSFPLGYLLFMIPLPAIIFFQIAFPLQLWASHLAETFLDLLQVPAMRQGNLLILPRATLEVAEACSGIRSLITLLALAVAYGYLAEKSRWKRLVLAVLAFPIAVVSNGVRLAATGVLTFLWGPKMAEGSFHLFTGCLLFLSAVACMLGAHKLLGWVGRTQEAAPC